MGSGVHKATSTESHTNRVTFETNAISITPSIHARQFVKNACIEPPFGESISINGTQKIVIIFTQGASSTTWNDISIIKAKIQFQNVLYLSYMNNSM